VADVQAWPKVMSSTIMYRRAFGWTKLVRI